MAEDAPEILLTGLSFPEAPRWRAGKLWFSDFYTHRVMTVDLKGQAETVVEVPQRPSGLGWLPDGTLLIVSMLDRQVLRLDGGRLRPYADLSKIATGPCNDMVVDARGRAYVGNFGFDRHGGEAERPATLARIDPDGRIVPAARDVLFPNGTVITPDGKTLILAESLGHRLTAFDIAGDGALGRRRVWADLAGYFPDGICLDAEGAVWVADARGKRVIRAFEGGRVDRTISTGEQGTYACILGGDDGRTLFICTSSGSGPAMANKRDGRIEIITVEAPGAGLP
ncbi:MAG: SMP-30/gluconolactonase/LRE family protein [Alphaproteobacteria bacterium]|nr:SMP-30/gluconolactonase/LRE family protein [Alphaproteobacteria bacterium]